MVGHAQQSTAGRNPLQAVTSHDMARLQMRQRGGYEFEIAQVPALLQALFHRIHTRASHQPAQDRLRKPRAAATEPVQVPMSQRLFQRLHGGR